MSEDSTTPQPQAGGSRVRTDLTQTVYRGFVRKEESWPEDSDEYRAGCEIQNRKLPPPQEVPGDAFDRQRVICGFDQGLIERQTCLVLGTGGVGQDVALTLARLGVGRIILVDRDVYDASNLTRQCLGCPVDVGQRKVDVAVRTLRERHCIVSEVEAVHCDAVLEWPRIVELARRSSVVFNCIDVGVMWDYCVNSLCKELGLPLCCGQSFGWKYMTEMYTGREDEVCAFCHDSTLSVFGANATSMARQGGVLDRLRIHSDAHAGRPGADVTEEYLAAFLAEDRQYRCAGATCREVVRCSLARINRQALSAASLADDLLAFLRALNDEVVERLLPGRVGALADVAFIPRPTSADTRYIGSWVCPCFGCAVTMVSQWAAWLTAPPLLDEEGAEPTPARRRRNVPQTVTFNLDVGLTGEEQLGYELGALGMPPDRSERRFVCEAASTSCAVCRAAAELRAEESLFVGRLQVVLAPAPGLARPPPAWRASPPEGSAEFAAAAAAALARRRPLAHLGEDYATAVVPALPALDWEGDDRTADAGCPPELSTLPMLKVPPLSEEAAHPSAVWGLASGVRSALVKVRRRWWRLKGCGNRDEGFPAQACGDRGELSVRGCLFEHTVATELRMTELASAALARAGLDCANRAVASYRYEAEPGWPMPKIDRHCAVFETLGNARLGDHLVAGLLRLLPHLLPAPPDGFAALSDAIKAGRGAEDPEPLPTAMVASCGLKTADAPSELLRRGLRLEEAAPPPLQDMAGVVPEPLAGVWERCRTRLSERLGGLREASPEPSLLLWLAWRLGWECGAAVRALHEADIAWGTYPDAMGIHCNAHVNNLVVKPPGAGAAAGTFLAALDFDMAFVRGGYVAEAAASHAGLGLDGWEGVLNFEATMGMKTTLSGSDFANTGVANDAAAVALPASHAVPEIAFRDTLVTAYDAARAGAEDAHPVSPPLYEAAYDLIRLALCTTTHVEG